MKKIKTVAYPIFQPMETVERKRTIHRANNNTSNPHQSKTYFDIKDDLNSSLIFFGSFFFAGFWSLLESLFSSFLQLLLAQPWMHLPNFWLSIPMSIHPFSGINFSTSLLLLESMLLLDLKIEKKEDLPIFPNILFLWLWGIEVL